MGSVNLNMGIFKLLAVMCILTGCATTNQQLVTHGADPYIEGTTTIERLREIPDLDNQPKLRLLFIHLRIKQDKENLVQTFLNCQQP